MKLKLVISIKNKTIRLINVDAKNTLKSSERDLDTWKCGDDHNNLRYTTWNNKAVNKDNPYKFNRVNVHYTDLKSKTTITTSYYCISEVILMNEMDFESSFDSNTIS